MLCRNLKHILSSKTSENYRLMPSRHFSRQWIDKFFAASSRSNMSAPLKLRHIFKELFVSRFFQAWRRSFIFISVVKKWNKDGVVQCFRQNMLRPRRTLLFTVTAAYKNNEEKPGPPGPCGVDITDAELSDLLSDLESIDAICRATLYCPQCERRVLINNSQPNVRYCECDHGKSPEHSWDGWEPFMEAQDIIIWRKEYKPGPLYAYKVYGRYKHIRAEDFAVIQIDGGYRKVWDTAVSSLSIVEHAANGKADQFVLLWEVLWPRLFANRDYVYLRRHKEFSIKSRPYKHKDRVFDSGPPSKDASVEVHERPNVHSNAKRKAMEDDAQELLKSDKLTDNMVYVIVSRSCTHNEAPVNKKAIRVEEYWSHMVVKTLNGPDKPGMEFVLTYYDEPAVGGLPTAVTSWAMGRAGPAFLERMRKAAQDYTDYRKRNPPDPNDGPTNFAPPKGVPHKVGHSRDRPREEFDPSEVITLPLAEQDMEPSVEDEPKEVAKTKTTNETEIKMDDGVLLILQISELALETSKQGPEMSDADEHRHQATQTEGEPRTILLLEIKVKDAPNNIQVSPKPKTVETSSPEVESTSIVAEPSKPVFIQSVQPNKTPSQEETDELDPDSEDQRSWWRYLYPFNYFS